MAMSDGQQLLEAIKERNEEAGIYLSERTKF